MNDTLEAKTRPSLTRLAVVGALAPYLLLQLVSAWRAGWVFEYPLDDVYIHLAMASEIARGGYGVNAGEAASAASSPLYPFLLAAFPESALQRVLPLIWNVLALLIGAGLFAAILRAAGGRGALVSAVALLVPAAYGTHAAAFSGMEHSLHGAASLLIIYGLVRLFTDGRVTPWLFLGILAAPLLRFEGVALSLMAAFALFLVARRGWAALALVLAFIPLAGFMAFLVSLGLDPLPSSVSAKLGTLDGPDLSRLERSLRRFGSNLSQPNGIALASIPMAALILRTLDHKLAASRRGILVWVLVGAGGAHLVFGQIGWMERYEHYALYALGAGLIALALGASRPGLALAVSLAPAALSGATYARESVTEYFWNPRAIHLQQGQMARFAQDFAGTNVAINDLGRVVWGNPNYVLDLWGLANSEARRIRLSAPDNGWAGPLATEYDVGLAMIYESWLGEAVPDGWIRLGQLHISPARGFLGGAEVDFYATRPEEVTPLVESLRAFASTLPEGARFAFEPGIE
ncbi:MAG: hypothetical protein AAF871_09610 [Pseudomonadota bacterium]